LKLNTQGTDGYELKTNRSITYVNGIQLSILGKIIDDDERTPSKANCRPPVRQEITNVSSSFELTGSMEGRVGKTPGPITSSFEFDGDAEGFVGILGSPEFNFEFSGSSTYEVAKPPILDLVSGSDDPHEITLEWTSDSTVITDYEIERSTNNFSGFTKIADVGDVRTYVNSISPAEEGVTFFYRIRAVYEATPTGYSNVESGVSGYKLNPPNLTKASGSNDPFIITLEWTNQSTISTNYTVERADLASGPFASLATGVSVTTYVDPIADEDTGSLLWYRVKATFDGDESGYSNIRSGISG
jgi:hypothetical protein